MRNFISKDLSDKVVSIIHEITDGDVNIMTEGGRIISSADPSRIGTVHEGGARIMSGEEKEIAITQEAAYSIKGAKAGYNGRILYKNKLIGCIGIGGDPDIAKHLQKMAVVIVNETLAREEQHRREKELRDEAVRRISNIAEDMTVLSLNGSIQAAKIGQYGDGFKVVAVEMRNLAGSINDAINFFKSE